MSAFVGTGALARLILRRDRIILPVWVLYLGGISVVLASATLELFPTDAELAQYHESIVNNPALTAWFGPVYAPTAGALVAWRVGIVGVGLGIASLLTVIRHTRTEEEAGRRELLGSTVVGRHAPLAAALLVTFTANAVVAAIIAAGWTGLGLPPGGSAAFALSVGVTGWMFASVGAVAAQLAEGAGAARSLALSVLGLSFALRSVADAGSVDGGASWLGWLTPMGWAQRVRPFAGERWWLLVLGLAAVVVIAMLAAVLSARRDVGAGVLRSRPGPATASPGLRSPSALAWRLQRGSALSWIAVLAVLGVLIGGSAGAVADLAAESPELADVFERLGGGTVIADTYISAVLSLMFVVAVSAYAIQAALRLRAEETGLRAEPVLATSVGRLRWVLSHLAFALLGPAVALAASGLAIGLAYGLSIDDVGGQVGRVLAAALIPLPAAWLLAGIVVLLFGLRPGWAPLSWAALALFLSLGQLGELLELDQWVLNLSPFTHLPELPGGDAAVAPLVWLLAITAALLTVGLGGFRRRDVG